MQEEDVLDKAEKVLEGNDLMELSDIETELRHALELETYKNRKLYDKYSRMKYKFMIKLVVLVIMCVLWKLFYFDLRNMHGMQNFSSILGTLSMLLFILPTAWLTARDLRLYLQSSRYQWWMDRAKVFGYYSVALELEESQWNMQEYSEMIDRVRVRINKLHPKEKQKLPELTDDF